MKLDIYNHTSNWEAWKENLTDKYIEEELTKENSKLFIDYLLDMEQGRNIPKKSVKGGRNPKTLNRMRSKIGAILRMFQNNGVKDVSKVDEKKVVEVFHNWKKEGHSNDYAKRFKAFWNWWITKNRREGILIQEVGEDLETSNTKESIFVWITKDELMKDFIPYFEEVEQTILLFCFDTIIRSPTELFSLKVENVYNQGEEIWIDIPEDISKTFGRRFNLVYSGEAIQEYIKKNELKPEDLLFDKKNYSTIQKKLKRIAFQNFEDKKSGGGEYYKNISFYDLRHSGGIHYRKLFQETGQSLDSLRERGGWINFKMIDYYTKRLGLDGRINRNKLLLEEDKTKIEKEMEKLKEEMRGMRETFQLAKDFGSVEVFEGENKGMRISKVKKKEQTKDQKEFSERVTKALVKSIKSRN